MLYLMMIHSWLADSRAFIDECMVSGDWNFKDEWENGSHCPKAGPARCRVWGFTGLIQF